MKLHSKEAGVKSKKFLDDLVNATFGWQVQGDLKEGIDRGVKDVPTFFVNGKMVAGKPTYEELSKAIENAFKDLKKGTVVKPYKAVPKEPKVEKVSVKKVKAEKPAKEVKKVIAKKPAEKSSKLPVKAVKVSKPLKIEKTKSKKTTKTIKQRA